MLKFNHFKTLLQELKVFDQYMPVLLSNGFDDWDSVVELNEEILNQIGLFFSKFSKIFFFYRNYKSGDYQRNSWLSPI